MSVFQELVSTMQRGSNSVSLQVKFQSGRVEQKVINLTHYLQILSSSSTNEENYMHIGQIPDGYYDGAISYVSKNIRVIYLIPEKVREIVYYGDSFIVPFPNLVFYFDIIRGTLRNSSVFAIDNLQKLYHYPFGNVHQGNICWGTTKLPNICSIKESGHLIGLFFGSETNNDYYRPGTNVVNKPQYEFQRGLLEELSTLDTFPYEILIQINSNFFAVNQEFLGLNE